MGHDRLKNYNAAESNAEPIAASGMDDRIAEFRPSLHYLVCGVAIQNVFLVIGCRHAFSCAKISALQGLPGSPFGGFSVHFSGVENLLTASALGSMAQAFFYGIPERSERLH